MKVRSFVFFALLVAGTAFASNCTDWTRTSGVNCLFAGRTVDLWVRQCENPCGRRNYGAHCDLEDFCHNENPNFLETTCSEWTKEPGVTCRNPNTGDWEQRWTRSCQRGLETTWCSDTNPNK